MHKQNQYTTAGPESPLARPKKENLNGALAPALRAGKCLTCRAGRRVGRPPAPSSHTGLWLSLLLSLGGLYALARAARRRAAR